MPERISRDLLMLRNVGIDDPDPPETPPSAELQQWREAHGRANRIGDCPDGVLPAECLKTYRELFPGRAGDRVFDSNAGTMPIPGGPHDGGRWQSGYFVPHKVT
jgi:hypothetical protein